MDRVTITVISALYFALGEAMTRATGKPIDALACQLLEEMLPGLSPEAGEVVKAIAQSRHLAEAAAPDASLSSSVH
jgi:hypothetical protein